MTDLKRNTARKLCNEAISRGEPLAWFEQLYSIAEGDTEKVPWADLEPNPNLVSCFQTNSQNLNGKSCLKIGCGLGDDAEYLAQHGGSVTAFDISPTAIEWCRKRFPKSDVQYRTHDLLDLPDDWRRRFDFVLESYTLQVLPPEVRAQAITEVADLVASDGVLLIICRGRNTDESVGEMPWPLTKSEVLEFENNGLVLSKMEEFEDDESPPVRRIRAQFQRPRSSSI